MWKHSGSRDRWLWNWTWLNTNKYKVTLWNLSCEICTPSSSYMSQAAVWTSEYKAISFKCAPTNTPHPPTHFLHTQTKAASLGKELSHLGFCVEAKPARKPDSLVVSMSVYKLQSTPASLLRHETTVWFVQKQSVHNLARPNIQVKVSTRISKRWSFIALAGPKERCSSLPSGFDLAAG